LDQLLADADAETTTVPEEESTHLGGLDNGGLLGGFLGGFPAPSAKEDKPEGAAKIE
jgi:hypothetical protein